ncbi:MAG: sigma-54 interaction domain-containing protein [Gemmobacter sp.]
MSDVVIDAKGFARAERLADAIARRRVGVVVTEDPSCAPAGAAIVCSSTQEAAAGGLRGLTERLRAQRPRLVMIVDEAARSLTHETDLGGRVIRLGLPAPAAEVAVAADFALLHAADILCADVSNMIAADPSTTRLMDLADRVSRSDVTVFVNGPTGTGKEVLARYVHLRSGRKGNPFVAINCAAIPENMLEAVLFGHEKGAFTGASLANKGIFRAAEGGTLLLDEISEMPLGLQSKLLRVLQERTVTPLGGQAEIKVDVRIVATTNRDIHEEVRQNRFREDLFYRLNVFPLATRALSERRDDIVAIAAALLRKHCPAGTAGPMLEPAAIDLLLAHDWPGNVRELENVMQRALVLHADGVITAADIIVDAPSDGLRMMHDERAFGRRVAGMAG